MVFSPLSILGLTAGCARSACAATLTKNGIGESLTPSRAAKSSRALARSSMSTVTSASTKAVG
jgi:hypothetical protein